MSRDDVASHCTKLQAEKVLKFLDEGWGAELEAGGEVKLSIPGHSKWVDANGVVCPQT